MVGEMFNTQLKSKLDALCSDLAAHVDTSETAGGPRAGVDVSYRPQTRTEDWWPAGLGRPGAVGAQNDLRYAVFPETRRLVIDDQGTVSVYDTGSIGFSASRRPKVPIGRSHSPARTDW
jgi:hypothetical protein